MLRETGFSSINQMAAETRLLETWKAINVPKYPLKQFFKKKTVNGRETRATVRGDLLEYGASKCFWNVASKLYNGSPSNIKCATTISQAKREIKKFVKTLPV